MNPIQRRNFLRRMSGWLGAGLVACNEEPIDTAATGDAAATNDLPTQRSAPAPASAASASDAAPAPALAPLPPPPPGAPAWLPPEGMFADIGLNTMVDVAPPGWPRGDAAGPFANWSGGVFAPQFSSLGGYVVHGSGHLAAALSPTWAGMWCFDLDTLRWVGRNVPAAPLLEDAPGPRYNAYGESLDPATLGHTIAQHTYDGMIYLPPSQGGGPRGSLVRLGLSGNPFKSPVHRFDLSSPTAPPVRVFDDYQPLSRMGGYDSTCHDTTRNVIYRNNGNGNGPLVRINVADWTARAYPNVSYNVYGNQSMIYIPPPWDCIVGVGTLSASAAPYWWLHVLPLDAAGEPKQWFKAKLSGAREPADTRCGGVWSTLLQCLVSYEGNGSRDVHKIIPPPPGDLNGTWRIEIETLAGVGSAVPSKSVGGVNGAWSRFAEAPSARCFLWCDSVVQPVQAWRLKGM